MENGPSKQQGRRRAIIKRLINGVGIHGIDLGLLSFAGPGLQVCRCPLFFLTSCSQDAGRILSLLQQDKPFQSGHRVPELRQSLPPASSNSSRCTTPSLASCRTPGPGTRPCTARFGRCCPERSLPSPWPISSGRRYPAPPGPATQNFPPPAGYSKPAAKPSQIVVGPVQPS